jgi:hypothetical protein
MPRKKKPAFEFTRHGARRALERQVSAREITQVLLNPEEELEGWQAGTRIRVAATNGDRLAVLFFPGRIPRVHSVWWESWRLI